MNKRVRWLLAIAAVIAIACFVLYRNIADRGDPGAARARGTSGEPSTSSPAIPGSSSSNGSAVAPARITRFASPAERQAVAERIARAHAARVQQAPSRPPSLPDAPPETDDGNDLARVGPQLKVALEAAIPFLAECYKTGPLTQSRQRRPAVLLTLTGDPSVATLIAADELRDQDGQALDSELDSCLRTTLDSLQLPPLDTTRDLHLQYSFAIDDD